MVKKQKKYYRNLIKELSGSVSVPKKYKGKDMDKMIEEAKIKRFRGLDERSKYKL